MTGTALASRDRLEGFLKPLDPATTEIELAVAGIHCAGCIATIEREMASFPGVVQARLNFTDKRLRIAFRAAEANPSGVVGRLSDLGFTAHPFSPIRKDDAADLEQRRLLRALGVAGFAAMNIMLLSVVVWAGHETGLDATSRDFFHWVSALIALPTAAYAGRVFFDSAIAALKRGRVNMDVPISLGIMLALGMSVVETLNHGEHAYFDGAVMLIFFLLIGRTLDQAMQRRTRAVAANVAALRAESVTKRLPDGSLREMAVDMVHPGDVIMVQPGMRIGLDGVIEQGSSDLDQSLVTGETAHQSVRTGDKVYAGTLNLSGLLAVRVLKPYTGTLLADVERLLAKATEARGAYVRLADRAAQLYAPFVHAAALLTFLGWLAFGLPWSEALVIAITVLIITCPCALGLAIPAVQVVAAGALFRAGVLVNSGDALERLAVVDAVVLDKTGTLTLPSSEIANLDMLDARMNESAARLALASRHPLASPVAALAKGAAPFPTVRERPGEGVVASDQGEVLKLGSPAFCGAEPEAIALAAIYPDASFVAFSDGEAHAVFAIRQPLRADAAEAVARLGAAGLAAEIVSGDRPLPVEAAARQLGLRDWQAGATPADKVRRLDELKAEGSHVLMIGDGINDAPALAAAHVSMSPVSATHLAQAQADFLLLGQRLGPAADAVLIARKARALMMQNLWFSVIYNCVAVPVAISGHATPLVAALAMSGSSLIVMLNALRARTGGQGA
jgi:Cu2+-exporting ATPase